MAKDSDKTKAQRNAADTNEDYTPVATSREIGRNSQGEPTIYPSDVEAVQAQYGLTTPEAEKLILSGNVTDKAADKIKAERVVYRQHYEYVVGATSNPLTVADMRQAEADQAQQEAEDARKAQVEAVDTFSPGAGPYGPEATYSEVESPKDRDHTSPRQPEEVK